MNKISCKIIGLMTFTKLICIVNSSDIHVYNNYANNLNLQYTNENQLCTTNNEKIFDILMILKEKEKDLLFNAANMWLEENENRKKNNNYENNEYREIYNNIDENNNKNNYSRKENNNTVFRKNYQYVNYIVY